MTPRWHVVGQDTYGYSPAIILRGKNKAIQKMREDYLIGLHKVIEPPVVAPSSMKNESINTFPGGLNFNDDAMTGKEGLRSLYQINPSLTELNADIQSQKQDIREGFFNDLFLMLATSEQGDKTAYEIARKYEEKLTMLGPVLERTHGELLSPAIDRVFNHMQRLGFIPPPPPELQGMELKVEYISILAQAQKLVTVSGIQQFTGLVGQMATVKPDVLDKVDFDDSVDQLADAIGIPPTMVVSDADVAQLREARAKQQQEEQAQQTALTMAKGAKDLSQADMGGNNALRALIQGAQQ